MAIIDKEKRQKKKAERQEKRDVRMNLDTRLGEEKTRLGMTDTPVSPLGSDRKAAIDKEISSTAAEKYREGLKKMQEGTQLKTVADPAAPTDEQLKHSLRKERRAKTSDILTALGRGLQGKSIDPSSFKSSRIRKDREDLYNQFKEASKGAKARREEYEQGYRQQQIDYLKDLASKETSDLKRREIESRIAKEQELANKYAVEAKWKEKQPYYKPSSSSSKKDAKLREGDYAIKGSRPYTRLLQSISPNVDKLIPPKEDGKPYTSSEMEDKAAEIILQLYEIKNDDKGGQYLTPMEGVDARGELGSQAREKEVNALVAPIDTKLAKAKKELEEFLGDDPEEGTRAIEWIDRPKREALESTIKELEDEKSRILTGYVSNKQGAPDASTETDGLDPWDL